ncbi:hypothetical protein [Lactobacillus amylovorus]|uniref:hypothetical protein n=1 Tax=Lactobacillus amylovorus TaxID=1604 RepID=UPI00232CC034|nr:hypothetical protein [Lactobacillus amylovorus]MDB6270896.1 hypothetical protein [Lactobacillus amylovorus]
MTETKTKYEIMIDVMRTLGVSSFDLREIEKYLRKIDAEADEHGRYAESYCKSVVDHFKLEKEISKSDKAMITSLRKQVKDLQKQNQQLIDKLKTLKTVKSMVNEVNDNLQKGFNSLTDQINDLITDEEPTYTDVSGVQMDNYPSNQTYTTTESSSQQ